jgi:thiol:disulfide interchange protein DsbC
LSGLDAEIYIFLFPLTDLHPLAYRKSVSVWCNENRVAALDRVMADQSIDVKDCDHPVDRNIALGARLGVRATPTIILEDGRWLEGYRPARELTRLLEMNQP